MKKLLNLMPNWKIQIEKNFKPIQWPKFSVGCDDEGKYGKAYSFTVRHD